MNDQVAEIENMMTVNFPPPYDREPQNFRFTTIDIVGAEESKSGVKFQIVRAPDRDGKPTYIPIFSDFTTSNVIDDFARVSPERVRIEELTAEQARRVKFALEELGWPVALAVHVLNRPDVDLANMPKPESVLPGDYSWMWHLVGEGGIGKSAIVTMLAMTHDVEVFGWDVFSDKSHDEYLKAMEKFRGKETTLAEVLEEIKRVRREIGPKRFGFGENVTLRDRLDVLLERFKLRNRPNVIIGDTPGVNGQDGKPRPMDIFDIFAWQSSEYVTSWMERFVDEHGYAIFLQSFPGMRVQAMYNIVEVARRDMIDGLERIVQKKDNVA